MTFEEFFRKKKIDLKTFGAERPGLLEEFIKHFAAMGEKSFDHTKKYWFNKLRKSYPLKEIPVSPSAASTAAAASPRPAGRARPWAKAAAPTGTKHVPAEDAEPASAPGAEPTSEAGVKTETDGAPSSGDTQSGPARKPGFKPRFKAGKTTVSPSAKEEPEKAAGKTEKASGKTEENPPGSEGENKPAAKPAYKPRFRPGVTPVKKKDSGE